jgi:hypothetical protein
MELRTQTEGLAISLELGLVTEAEVIAWADGQLAALSEIPDALVDVSMANGASSAKLISLLRAVPGTPDPFDSVKEVLQRISSALERGDLDTEGAARLIGVLHSAGRAPSADAGAKMASVSGADVGAFLKSYC